MLFSVYTLVDIWVSQVISVCLLEAYLAGPSDGDINLHNSPSVADLVILVNHFSRYRIRLANISPVKRPIGICIMWDDEECGGSPSIANTSPLHQHLVPFSRNLSDVTCDVLSAIVKAVLPVCPHTNYLARMCHTWFISIVLDRPLSVDLDW